MKKCLVMFLCIFCLSACVPARVNKVVATPSTTVQTNAVLAVADDFPTKEEQQDEYAIDFDIHAQDASVKNSSSIFVWELSAGSLYGQLEDWAKKADYQLVWQSENDLQMMTNATFNGLFTEAIEALFSGLAKLGHSFTVTLYTTNRVLEVKEN